VRTRQVQFVSWEASAALHSPDGPAAQRRNAYVTDMGDRLAWIHGYDAMTGAPVSAS
jgi:salicylate hydroxylase